MVNSCLPFENDEKKWKNPENHGWFAFGFQMQNGL